MAATLTLVNPLSADDAQRIGLAARGYAIGEVITVEDWAASTLVRTGYATAGAPFPNTLLTGTGPPDAGIGANGSYYLDTSAQRLYGPKTGGAWPVSLNPGRGVTSAAVSGGRLILTYSDGATADLGNVQGPAGSGTSDSRLDGLTAAATPNVVVLRDANARFKAADPSAAQDVATKNYADLLGVSTATASTIVRRDSAGRFAAVSPSATGDVATKGYADGLGVSTATVSTIVRRDSAGRFAAVDPSATGDVATKNYVDTRDALYVPLTQRGAASGVATLGADGLIPSAQLPPVAITDTFVVADQAAMLALTAQVGDVAVRTDGTGSFILRLSDPTQIGSWQRLNAPTDAVISVDGQTGAVSLGDVAASASSLARRGSGGTLIAAAATLSTELSTLGQQTSAIAASRTATVAEARQEPVARSVSAATTIAASDAGDVVLVSNTSTTAQVGVTIPTNASVSIPVGTFVDVAATNVGGVVLLAASGVTLRGERTVGPNYGVVRLVKIGTDEWLAMQLSGANAARNPSLRVYRSSGTGYNVANYLAVPYDTVDATQTYNPDEEWFQALTSVSERRILVKKAGEYLVVVNMTSSVGSTTYTRICEMTGANTTGKTYANTSGQSFMNLAWRGRLAAGSYIGASHYSASGGDSADGPNEYRNDLTITRIGA